MKNAVILFIVLIFAGCSNVSENISKIKSFTKCYIHQIPAPYWVCYQSSFTDVGKLKVSKDTRLNEEIVYTKAINNLTNKLQTKTSILLKKLNIKNEKIISDVKSYVVINAIQKGSWYDKKNKILYVLVEVDKNNFRNFLQQKLKIDKKIFEDIFDESF